MITAEALRNNNLVYEFTKNELLEIEDALIVTAEQRIHNFITLKADLLVHARDETQRWVFIKAQTSEALQKAAVEKFTPLGYKVVIAGSRTRIEW